MEMEVILSHVIVGSMAFAFFCVGILALAFAWEIIRDVRNHNRN